MVTYSAYLLVGLAPGFAGALPGIGGGVCMGWRGGRELKQPPGGNGEQAVNRPAPSDHARGMPCRS